MKSLFTILGIALFILTSAQQKQNDPLFDNWFADQPRPTIQTNNGPPPPPVPLDGGLIGLIAAGGAMGYRKYKQKANKEV